MPAGFGQRSTDGDARRAAEMIWLPPAIRSFVTRGGKLLDAQLQHAWGWLARHVDQFPAEVPFQMAELGAYFYSRSAAQPTQWVRALVREGLAEVVESRRGRRGGMRVRLLDPELVAELRVKRANPQRELPIEVEPPPPREPADPETLAWSSENLSARSACAEVFETEQTENLSARSACAEVFEPCVAAGDAPLALLNALESRLGAERFESWLGRSRWCFGETSQLFLPSPVVRDFVRREMLAEVRAALADAGLPTAVEFLVDADLPPPQLRDGAKTSAQGALALRFGTPTNNQRLVSRSSSLASTNQPTNQPNDFWDQADGPEPDIVRQGRELYERIGDWSLYRGVALRAVDLLARGAITRPAIDELLRARRHDFNVALRRLAGRGWVPIGQFKSHFQAAYHVDWKRRWDRARKARPK